jgi:gpW
MATCDETKALLAEAEAALHQVLIGGAVTLRHYGDKQTNYAPANANALRSYVEDLRNEVHACNGVTVRRRRAIYFTPVG